jgi:hypothetical protein
MFLKDKWKIVSDNADTINMALLRQQQLRLAVVKTVKAFFSNQNFLRIILKQQVMRLKNEGRVCYLRGKALYR